MQLLSVLVANVSERQAAAFNEALGQGRPSERLVATDPHVACLPRSTQSVQVNSSQGSSRLQADAPHLRSQE